MTVEEINELYNSIVKEKTEIKFIDFDFNPELNEFEYIEEITRKVEDLSLRSNIPIEEINEKLAVDVENLFKKRVLSTNTNERFELIDTTNLNKEQTMEEQITTEKEVKEVKDYRKQWQEYEFDTLQPLITKDVYAFFGKGGTAEFLSEKLSELSGQQVSISNKYIKNIDLWNNIVKPFRELPQEKQTELKESLISFVAQKQQEVQNKTPEQKSQEMYNFYHQYEIRPDTKLTKHDLYAFMLQFGAKGKNKMLEVAGKILGQEIQAFEGVKGVDFEKFVINPLLEKGEEASKIFKEELCANLPAQTAIQEEKQAIQQQKEPWAIRHLRNIDVETGLTDKNIFALSQLQGDEHFQEAREQLFQNYLGLSSEEVKALDKTQMIDKVKEIKYGTANQDGLFERNFKSDIQKVYIISEAEKNLQNTDLYAQQLATLEYPEKGNWEIQHIDKLMSENNILNVMYQMDDLDFINRYGNTLGELYGDVALENIVYTQTFHEDTDFIEAKQDLLNVINHSTNDFKEKLLENLENKNDNAIRMSR